MHTAFVFPGQGSQTVGMCDFDGPHGAIARAVFAEASNALDFALDRLVAQGPAHRLQLTEFAQPAILTTSIAQLRSLRVNHPEVSPIAVAGHSLGEYSALVAAEALSLTDAVRLVRLRGRAMQAAVPTDIGTMAAIVGLSHQAVARVCREVAGDQVVTPAGFNSPLQVAIAGHVEAVDRAMRAATAAGARKVARLNVSAPFHCALLAPAGIALSQALADVPLARPCVPLVANVDGAETQDVERIRLNLVDQVSKPVLWTRCARRLSELGATRFLELGPGRTLMGLQRRIDRNIKVLSLAVPKSWQLI